MATLIVTVLTLLLLSVVTCQDSVLQYYFIEELEADSVVGNLVTDSGLNQKYDQVVLNQLRYSFHEPSSQHVEYFKVDNGLLKIAKPLDRETICPRMEDCSINLGVTIQPSQYFQIIKVKLNVQDKNDNIPSFVENTIERTLSEASVTGTVLSLPKARDNDSPIYGIQRYELVSNTSAFELQVSARDVQLVLKQPLDREVKANYYMQLVAYDGGSPPQSGTVPVHISVLDINDNHPVFQKSEYTVSISEVAPVRKRILEVFAEDRDAGSNSNIVYDFSSETATESKPFEIDHITGEIYVREALDHETKSLYEFEVTAQDQGSNSLVVSTRVIVTILDSNDNAPHITVNGLPANGSVPVSESANPGDFVAHISVVDPDSGPNGQFNCTINSEFFRMQQLFTTEFKLILTTRLDREIREKYSVAMVCEDFGNPSQSSTKYIPIVVQDKNDHAPRFVKTAYNAEVRENGQIGVSIVQVLAVDDDAGPNAAVKYSLAGENEPYFAIDPITGVITTKMSFDREQKDVRKLTVIATDSGKEPMSTIVVVTVNITDMDDQFPKFSKETYRLGVYENQPLGTEVGQVYASDGDLEPNNKFTLVLEENTDSLSFFLDPDTGKLFTKVPLNRESQRSYTFKVLASPVGDNTHTASAEVTVYVADMNDNVPTVSFPSTINNTIHVFSNSRVGEAITRIVASDADAGTNMKLSFAIVSGNDEGCFTIDESTGIISVYKDLGDRPGKAFGMVLRVADSGSPKYSVDVILNVIVDKAQGGVQNWVILVGIIAGSLAAMIALVGAIVFIMYKGSRDKNKKKYSANAWILNSQTSETNDPEKQPEQVLVKKESSIPTVTSTVQPYRQVSFTKGDNWENNFRDLSFENEVFNDDRSSGSSRNPSHRSSSFLAANPPNSRNYLGAPPARSHWVPQLDEIPKASAARIDGESVSGSSAAESDSGRGSNEDHDNRSFTLYHPAPPYSYHKELARKLSNVSNTSEETNTTVEAPNYKGHRNIPIRQNVHWDKNASNV